MATQIDVLPRTLRDKTVVVVSRADRPTQRPAQPDRPASTTQAAREKEADRWVAQMMFDHYNG